MIVVQLPYLQFKMKKILSLSLAVFIALAAFGCSGESDADKGPAIDAAKDADVKKEAGAGPTQAND